MPQNYLITGATSGIGEALARALVARGDNVIGTGRRQQRLEALQAELGERFHGVPMDVTQLDESIGQFERIFREVRVDVVILNAGVSLRGEDLDWKRDATIVETNALAFTAQAACALRHFLERGGGHLVGISSVAGQLVSADGAAYCATKAFVSRYLRGLRLRVQKAGLAREVFITDLRPGFIETPMIETRQGGVFWAISAERCAEIMLRLMDRRARCAYVPRRWWLIAQFGRLMPDAILRRS